MPKKWAELTHEERQAIRTTRPDDLSNEQKLVLLDGHTAI